MTDADWADSAADLSNGGQSADGVGDAAVRAVASRKCWRQVTRGLCLAFTLKNVERKCEGRGY